MTTANDLTPPAWVHKRDGRLVPFDADKIARVLFAAGEECGRPDPFLARELADGIVHFLAGEIEGQTPSTEQVSDVVVKVVRELGHPHVAERFAEFGRRRRRHTRNGSGHALPITRASISLPLDAPLATIRTDCVRQYTLQTVFSRDLAAAHRDELLTLTGLETPAELSACLILSPATQSALLPLLEATSRRAGEWIVLDGPEYALLPTTGKRLSRREIEKRAEEWMQTLRLGLRLTGRKAILNLHVSQPPPWADDLAEGPLFAGQRRIADHEHLPALASALCEAARSADGAIRIDWHLAERDFAPDNRAALLEVARAALEGEQIAFVFDQPRRPLALAEGIDRRHPFVLMDVGLNLPRLGTLVCEEGGDETSRRTRLSERLRSLVRLALSAAVQKRDYLRQQTREKEWTSGFLLDRARLLVAPLGLDHAVEKILGQRMNAGRQALEFGEQILTRLHEVLRQEGRPLALDCCLDSPLGGIGDRTAERAAGPTCWDPAAPVKSQLKGTGKLHGTTGGGTGLILLPDHPAPTADQVADWLKWTWQQTDVARLCWIRQPAAHRQLLFP